jgi:hypothetical protein
MRAEELVEEVAHEKPHSDGGREHQPEGAQGGQFAEVRAAGGVARLAGLLIFGQILPFVSIFSPCSAENVKPTK